MPIRGVASLSQLVESFEGQRHVQARLLNAEGCTLATSRLAAVRSEAPVWFERLISQTSLHASREVNNTSRTRRWQTR